MVDIAASAVTSQAENATGGNRFLHTGWKCAATLPGRYAEPAGLEGAALEWIDATVPGTVASCRGHDLDTPADFDAHDWWYVVDFSAEPASAGARDTLRFDGLATLAEVWLNGKRILSSRNMFVGHRVDVNALLARENRLAILFRSLDAALAEKRPRPRWKTALVSHQNLRWFRTTLLGRIPGWTPRVPPVGPWRAIALERAVDVDLAQLVFRPGADSGVATLDVDAHLSSLSARAIESARVRIGAASHDLPLRREDAGFRATATLTLPDVPLWWPHTHGEPALVPWTLEARVGGAWRALASGRAGFRHIALDTSDSGVRFVVNGVPVFCRGACWTISDFASLDHGPARRTLVERAREAGANMLRIGGTMVYEADDFYETCDELGILVWQDFMFANMDYPVEDAAFRAEIDAEARYQLSRLQRHACIAAYCGGSEIAQQAAMLGRPAGEWLNAFSREALPGHCARAHPGIPYFPSTPWGGALPFHVSSGVSHYYGVGAYRRPLADLKSAHVRFTTECLGFSNVPEPETMALILDGATPPPHHPRWKSRQPRDSGAGWDFEDVRDHYLRVLFGVDPLRLRGEDIERYYALSRNVTAEVMHRAFAEWRGPASGCGGALVWFWRDLQPGAGWGVVDSTGRPKSSWWALKRAWAPRAIFLTDEGLDGHRVHVVNDAAEALLAAVEVELLRDGRVVVGKAQAQVEVGPRAAKTLELDALLGYFSDSTASYGFGPPRQDVVCARLVHDGTTIAEDFMFPAGHALPMQHGARVEGEARRFDDGRVEVAFESDTFLQSVAIVCAGFTPSDNHFHLLPRRRKTLVFTGNDAAPRRFKVELAPLNADAVSFGLDPR